MMRTFRNQEQRFLWGALASTIVASGVLLFDPGYAGRLPAIAGLAGVVVDVNAAPFARLVTLDGFSPRRALAVVEARRVAPLATLSDLARIARLTPREAARLVDRVAFGPRPRPRRLDLATASVARLAAVPGIGATIAARIDRARQESGPPRSVLDLAGVRGIGPARLARLTGAVEVGAAHD